MILDSQPNPLNLHLSNNEEVNNKKWSFLDKNRDIYII